jgi:PKHD-type hydroxylase
MLPDETGLVRKLSVCITLNDNFKGGDFQIQKFVSPVEKKRYETIKEMRNAGSIVVFPSFMWHQITPVKYGSRYSIVCWYKGPQFM